MFDTDSAGPVAVQRPPFGPFQVDDHPFKVRHGFVARVVLPRDLTWREATRLSEWARFLAWPDTEPEDCDGEAPPRNDDTDDVYVLADYFDVSPAWDALAGGDPAARGER